MVRGYYIIRHVRQDTGKPFLPACYPLYPCGDVAQLGERGVRNAEVRGSSPLITRDNPRQSKEVQNPLEIAGFFLPLTYYMSLCVFRPKSASDSV